MIEIGNIKEKHGLFDHQVTGVQFLVKQKKCILGDEMGTGKTRQTAVACHYVSEKANVIVCPASLKINWQREIKTVFPHDDIFVVESGIKDKDIPAGQTWYIVNYDLLKKHSKALMALFDTGAAETIVFDEVHYIKGKSQRAEEALALAKKAQNVFGLTGTLMLNRPIELFNPLRAIGHSIATNRKEYGVRYCGAYLRRLYSGVRFWDETGATNLDELRAKIKPHILRRKKEDVLDLPPKLISIMDHELTPNQQGLYEQAWEDYVHWVQEQRPEEDMGNILVAQHIIELGKLKQVCSQAKIDRIVIDAKNAIEQGEKVIVFSQYTQTIEGILKGLRTKTREGRSVRPAVKAVRITGADDQHERQRAVDAMESDEKTVALVANIKAAGVGLNITQASVVMFADMEWSPEMHSQAEDRAHRQGQKKTVNVYYYIAKGTIDEDILEMLTEKKKIIQEVMDGTKKRVDTSSVQADFVARMQSKLSTIR